MQPLCQIVTIILSTFVIVSILEAFSSGFFCLVSSHLFTWQLPSRTDEQNLLPTYTKVKFLLAFERAVFFDAHKGAYIITCKLVCGV
jgi:hypothetical protein